MKCISCQVDIDPKWGHAIDMNVCPYCGKAILEEHLKNLFSSLRQTMEQLQIYPDQLNDWMLSNHNYIKTDAPDIKNYMPKEYVEELKKQREDELFAEKKSQNKSAPKKITIKVDDTESGEEEVVSETIQSEEETNGFFRRAEAIKKMGKFNSTVEKTEYLKTLANKIKRESSSAGKADMSAEILDNVSQEDMADYESAMSGGEVMSSLPDTGEGEDDIPSVVLAMASKSNGQKDNSADLAKLQQQQSRVAESRKNFQSGAKGSFSRG